MCEKCNRRTETTKSLTIQRFPKILVIRILYNLFTGYNHGNNDIDEYDKAKGPP